MALKRWLYRFYWWLEQRIVPGHASSQYAYYRELKHHVPEAPVWLDLGCGHRLFTDWMTAEQTEMIRRAKQIVGVDMDRPSLLKHDSLRDRVEGELERLPFPSDAFDLVTANMVVEHWRDAHKILSEIQRVLKPGGLFIFHTPNFLSPMIFGASLLPQALKEQLAWIFDERKAGDVFPTFYRMNTPGAIRRVGASASLSIVSLTLTNNSALTPILGPIVIFELLWIRLCRLDMLKNLRTNVVAVLRKPPLPLVTRARELNPNAVDPGPSGAAIMVR